MAAKKRKPAKCPAPKPPDPDAAVIVRRDPIAPQSPPPNGIHRGDTPPNVRREA